MTYQDDKHSAYDELAPYYDELQAEVDHQAFAVYLDGIVSAETAGTEPQGEAGRMLWLDLGCGTGSFLMEIDRLGYDCIGIDLAEGMLMEAREKAWESGRGTEILLLEQDITDFELYGSVNVISIVLDTLNHLADRAAVMAMLERCRTYLHQGGLLVFDVLTEERAQETLGDRQFFVVEDDFALFWSNQYNQETKRVKAELTIFETESDTGLYKRSDTAVEEQIYSHDEVVGMLKESGFELLRCKPVDAGFGQMDGEKRGAAESRMVYFAK